MSAIPVTSIPDTISIRYKTTSSQNIILATETGCGEIFIELMVLEILEGVVGGPRQLPDVAHEVIDLAELEQVDGVGGTPVLHVDVAHVPHGHSAVVALEVLPHGQVLVLDGHLQLQSQLLALPGAEGLGFMVVHFCRPVQRQLDQLGQCLQLVPVLSFPPEHRLGRLLALHPAQGFLAPVLLLLVPSVLHEFHKLSIRH